MTKLLDTVVAIAREATADYEGETILDACHSVGPASPVQIEFSSWPRMRQAMKLFKERGYDTYLVEGNRLQVSTREPSGQPSRDLAEIAAWLDA